MARSPQPQILRRQAGPMELLLLPCPGTGIVAAQTYFRRGIVDQSPGEGGLASFTASMLKRGTARRGSERLAFELESLGAVASHGAAPDSCNSSIQSAAADFPAALEIFFDCLRNPAFDARELEIERQATLAYLKRIEDDKFELTYRHYLRRIFAGHGYGRPSEGELAEVEAVTPDLCRAWHAKTYRPESLLLAVAGDFEPDALCPMLERLASGWAPPGKAADRCQAATAPPGRADSAAIEKEAEQGFIVLGFRGPAATHEDHPALRIACAALGEGFGGRLFSRLRDERSLAYAVGSILRSHRLGGHTSLYIGTQAARLEEAREGLLAEAEALRQEPLTEDDLARARPYAIGKYLMDHQRLASRAGYLARWEDLGAGAEYDARYADALREVTAEQALDAARRWWIQPTVVVLKPKK